MNQYILASNNRGKLAEFQALFDRANLGVQIITQGDLNIGDAIEDGLSFVENAIIKARHASRLGGLPAIADDSGLCVPILGNAPGIYSARYAGSHGDDGANNTKLLEQLKPYHDKGQVVPAFFVCVLALVRHADDPLPIIVEGLWQGQIVATPKGDNGFGYDPVFYVPTLNKTSAELDKSTKNQLSHRGQALQKLLERLQNDGRQL